MITEPFFSIIIPTYNRPVELKRAVESAIRQTFTNYEIIIVDNGTIEFKNNYQSDKITVVKEEREGGNYARNKGIQLAKGSFICFLDDDDEYLPNHLQSLFDLIQHNNSRIGLYKTYSRVEVLPGIFQDQQDPLKPIDMNNLHYIITYPMYMNTVCIHKDIFKKHVFNPEVKVAQDYDLWIRILAECDFFISPIITTIYYYSPQSTSRKSKQEKYYNYIDLYNKHFKNSRYGRYFPLKIKRDRIFKYYFWMLSEFKQEMKLSELIKVLFNLMCYNPKIMFQKKLYHILLK